MRQPYDVGVPVILLSPRERQNLMEIIDSQNFLLQAAFDISDLPIVLEDGVLWFPWFTLTGRAGEAETYTELIYTLCHMAKGPDELVDCLCTVQGSFWDRLLFHMEANITWKQHLAAKRLLFKTFRRAYRLAYGDSCTFF